MTIEDAYRVQRALVALKIEAGRTVRARKIGLTSRAMQHRRGRGRVRPSRQRRGLAG
jgi:2-keto-4-pentenoate hydratase